MFSRKKRPKYHEDWWRHCDLLRNWWLMKIDAMERIRLFFWWRLVDEDMAMCVFCLDISWGKLVNYSSFFLLAERWWTDGDVVIFWDFFRGIWRWCEKLRFGFVFWHSHGPFHKGLGSPWNVQTNPLVFWHGIIYWPAKNLSFFVGSLRLAMRIWDFQKLKLATFFYEINQR